MTPDGPRVSGATAQVVLLAADAARLDLYDVALSRAGISSRLTLDADEAESLIGSLHPDVLVLDKGLPRLVLFRLYGLIREDPSDAPVQVVFVGLEGETSKDDHYLPGESKATAVAAEVTSLVASRVDIARVASAGRRLDVILIRVGLVLLILGIILILIQTEAIPSPLSSPWFALAEPTQ